MSILAHKLLIAASKTLKPFLPLGTNPIQEQTEQTSHKILMKVTDGEMYFVVGKTGMGKTRLIKELIRKKLSIQPFKNVYHLDTKKRGDFSSYDGVITRSERAPPAFTTLGNRMVWQPPIDDIDEYSAFFTNILNAGMPAIVNVDESKNMQFNSRIPRGLSILLAQGRLPGIDVIGGTQEVAQSPRQMLSQASHIICFSVINAYDEHMMLRYLRIHDKKTLGLKKHQFLYLRPDIDDEPRFMNSFEQLLPLIV